MAQSAPRHEDDRRNFSEAGSPQGAEGELAPIDVRNWQGEWVFDPSGETVGKVADVLVDPDMNPEWMIISTGAFLHLDKLIPAFDVEETPDGFRIPFTKDQVKNGPDVDIDDIKEDEERALYEYWCSERSAAMPTTCTRLSRASNRPPVKHQEVREYLAQKKGIPLRTPVGLIVKELREEQERERLEHERREYERFRELERASGRDAAGTRETAGMEDASLTPIDVRHWQGEWVFDTSGDAIGKIADVLVDPEMKPEWLIVSMGAFLHRDKLVPAFDITEAENGFSVPFSKDQVKSGPDVAFDEMSDDEEQELYSYWCSERSAAMPRSCTRLSRSSRMMRHEEVRESMAERKGLPLRATSVERHQRRDEERKRAASEQGERERREAQYEEMERRRREGIG